MTKKIDYSPPDRPAGAAVDGALVGIISQALLPTPGLVRRLIGAPMYGYVVRPLVEKLITPWRSMKKCFKNGHYATLGYLGGSNAIAAWQGYLF